MNFVDVDGTLTRCIVAGKEAAPPLLLVHGLSLTSDIWLQNIDALGEDFFVVAPDMLGHGFTRPAPGIATGDIPNKVRHLVRLAEVFGFQKFAVCGSSYGALISAQLYLTNKDRVTKLVINGSGSCFNTESEYQASMQRIYASYEPTLTVSSANVWRERLSRTFYDPATIPQDLLTVLTLCYAQPWIRDYWEANVKTLMDLDGIRRYRVLERLEEFDVETLVVWGREDPGGVYESAVAAVNRMPNARLVTIERCGHMPMIEHPGEYNEALRSFLRSSVVA